jgi:osmoprotectant transport system ATP-binding protein
MASPSKCSKNPAHPIIKSFMGRTHGKRKQRASLLPKILCAQGVKVPKTSRNMECIDLMSRRDVNTSLCSMKTTLCRGGLHRNHQKSGKRGGEIAELLPGQEEAITIGRKEMRGWPLTRCCSSANYLIVLNDDRTVAGLITRTSMAKAMGDALWGEDVAVSFFCVCAWRIIR